MAPSRRRPIGAASRPIDRLRRPFLLCYNIAYVDVGVEDAAEWDEGPETVSGAFSLMDDREMGLFFKLSNAAID